MNASADRYLDLQVDGQPFEIVALDGMPLLYHDPKHRMRTTNHVLLAPAGRVEAIVTGLARMAPCVRFASIPVQTGIPIQRWCSPI